MNVAYARKNNDWFRYGEVFKVLGINKSITIVESNGIRYRMDEREIYFPNHPKGYNQPCFK